MVAGVDIPPFVPRHKKIQTDPNEKEEENPEPVNADELDMLESRLRSIAQNTEPFEVEVQHFEKVRASSAIPNRVIQANE